MYVWASRPRLLVLPSSIYSPYKHHVPFHYCWTPCIPPVALSFVDLTLEYHHKNPPTTSLGILLSAISTFLTLNIPTTVFRTPPHALQHHRNPHLVPCHPNSRVLLLCVCVCVCLCLVPMLGFVVSPLLLPVPLPLPLLLLLPLLH